MVAPVTAVGTVSPAVLVALVALGIPMAAVTPVAPRMPTSPAASASPGVVMAPVATGTPVSRPARLVPAAPRKPMIPVPRWPLCAHGPDPQRIPLADGPAGPDSISSPGSSGREPPPSPMVDRKKQRRKKLSTPSKTEGAAGQAEGESCGEWGWQL